MMKKILSVLLLIFLIGTVFAYEQPLTAYGFSGLINSTNSTTVCKEITVTLPDTAIAEKGEGILSLVASFVDDVNDSTYVSVSVNNGEEKKYWHESFFCTTECHARVFIPELKKGSTKLNICAVLGGASKSLVVSSGSYIGIYDTPVLSIKNSAPSEIFLGNRAKMIISATNSGTKATSIFVQFIHPDTRAKIPITSFDIVEGDSSATALIAPNETKEFIYYIKPSIISAYNLPLAALFFKNIFGEDETLLSNHPFMTVIEQKQIELSIVSISDTDPRVFKAIIKNNFDTPFNGIITMAPQTEFVDYSQNITVSSLSNKELFFEAKTLAQGKYPFQATIRDTNNIYSSNIINVEVTKSGISMQIILAIVGIIIGAVIFSWIYFVKVK